MALPQSNNRYICINGTGFVYASSDRLHLITTYFKLGFTYVQIVSFLRKFHGILLCVRQLKRILHQSALTRRTKYTDINLVWNIIQQEVETNGGTAGYRNVHGKLTKTYGLVVTRETVRICLLNIDPSGVSRRRCRRLERRRYNGHGANYIWHVDGWDKLKTYGLCVHGCMDGYSRRLIWLECARTNKDPYVIGSYFVNAVEDIGGVPRIVRADRGTENVNIEQMQHVLRCDCTDEIALHGTAFLYGRSTSNQRIEAFWSKIQEVSLRQWTEHFRDLAEYGVLDTSDMLHIECVRFCYMSLLRVELQHIRTLWNTHTIRQSSYSCCEPGKPDMLFFFPESHGSKDYRTYCNHADVTELRQSLSYSVQDVDCDCKELFQTLMLGGGKNLPLDLRQAEELYVYLIDHAEVLLA